MAKQVWLSEQEICDLLHVQFIEDAKESARNKKVFRECWIGRGRPDFLMLHSGGIEIYEVKITASLESVVQVAKYQRDLNEYLRQLFYRGDVDHAKCPAVSSNLVARYIDNQIIDLCAEFGIYLWRINVHSKTEISLDIQDIEFPVVPEYSPILGHLKSYYSEVLNG